MPGPIDVGAALGAGPAPDDYGPMPDLADAMGGIEPAEGEEMPEGDEGEESDADPDFLSLAADIFPEWGPGDPRFRQLQDLIDSRMGAAPEADEDE